MEEVSACLLKCAGLWRTAEDNHYPKGTSYDFSESFPRFVAPSQVGRFTINFCIIILILLSPGVQWINNKAGATWGGGLGGTCGASQSPREKSDQIPCKINPKKNIRRVWISPKFWMENLTLALITTFSGSSSKCPLPIFHNFSISFSGGWPIKYKKKKKPKQRFVLPSSKHQLNFPFSVLSISFYSLCVKILLF